jgi:hypothetical protein
MRKRLRTLAIGAVAAATVAGVGVMAGGGAAFAAGGGGSTPPWYSTETVAPEGSITFYNAQGQVVTGGNLTDTEMAAYAVASAPDTRTGDTKAVLYAYTPVEGENPLTWTGGELSLAEAYPNTSAPGGIGTTANPVLSGGADITLSDYIEGNPNVQTATGWTNLYDIRLETSGPGQAVNPDFFYETAISVDVTGTSSSGAPTGTWSVDYPDYTQNTTTTVTASPASPQTVATGGTAAATTLTATVSPTADATGTVTFWNETASPPTEVGGAVTVSGGTATSASFTPTSGTTEYEAIFQPTIGSADIGSDGTLNYTVQAPLDTTTTTLAETGGGAAAGPVTFTGTVTDTTNTSAAVTGTVNLFDNGSTTPFASATVGTGGAFSVTYTYTAAGSHSVVATFAGNSTQASSSSSAVTFTESAPACTTCNTTATIEGTVPAGTLSISTPYTATNPLNLGTLALNSAGTYFTATASLDSGAAGDVPGTSSFTGITIVDTQSGNLPWTVTALASNLTDGTGHPGGTISGENVGLTNLTPVLVSGNAITTGDVTVTNQPAATPPVSPTDTGSAGLGGTVAHTIAADTAQPDGTVGINGTVTLNAPTSTEAGVFVGTITFTIAS